MKPYSKRRDKGERICNSLIVICVDEDEGCKTLLGREEDKSVESVIVVIQFL